MWRGGGLVTFGFTSIAAGVDLFVRLHRREARRVIRFRLLAIDRQPARIHQHLAGALERLAFDAGDAVGFQKFRRRIKNRQEPLRHHVVQLPFRLGQTLRRLRGRDDGEVVGNLGVVEDAFVRMHPVVLEDRFGKGRVAGFAQHLQRALHRADVILRQRPRIRSRIGQHLVPLVKRLRQAKRVLCRKTKARVRVALQTGQIVKQRRHRSRRPAFLGDDARLAQAFFPNGFRPHLVPEALRLELVVAVLAVGFGKFFVEPASGVLPRRRVERADDLPEIARHEFANPRFAFDHDGQRRRLDAANGRLEKTAELGVERRHGARAVDAHQPVGFRPAVRGVGQRQHVLVFAKLREPFADGRRRHGLQPEPFDGLLRLGVLDDVAENQFAFAPGVAGVDQRVHVGAFDQLFEDLQPRLAFLNRQQIKMRRDDGQMFERPFAARRLDAFRRHDGEQMADRRRNDVLVAFVKVVHFLESAERLGDVAGDGRFLRNDESFAHFYARACTPGAANMRRKSFLSNLTRKINFEIFGHRGTKNTKFFDRRLTRIGRVRHTGRAVLVSIRNP